MDDNRTVSTDETSLGATIHAWRDRLTPADVGLPAGRGRRAVGLRREELSELAGISVDYIVRLEQGRAATPSAQIVSALARALRLSETPVAVFAADWRLIWWNRSWTALLGDPSQLAPEERSLVRSRFPVAGDHGGLARWPLVSENRTATDRAIVAD